jgi:hypothetical protein
MDERPYTQQNALRPFSASRSATTRPPSAIFSIRNATLSGTASRLATAMMQQPVSRTGTAMSLAGAQVCCLLFISLINTLDYLILQINDNIYISSQNYVFCILVMVIDSIMHKLHHISFLANDSRLH